MVATPMRECKGLVDEGEADDPKAPSGEEEGEEKNGEPTGVESGGGLGTSEVCKGLVSLRLALMGAEVRAEATAWPAPVRSALSDWEFRFTSAWP